MPRSTRRALTIVLVLGAASLLAGCSPKYPKCNKDEDCQKGEFCVNGMCQQCREDKDCGKGQFCKGGRCEKTPGYCDTTEDCPDGKACKDHRCVACQSDGDCGPGAKCKGGKCLRPGQCLTDADCPPNHECQNGHCVAPPSFDQGRVKCTPEAVYFDFNEFVLTSEATQKLQAAASCIKSVPNRTVRLEGKTDPRGTEEYNLTLGENRAQSVKRYLERLGVEGKRMRTLSKGKLEATGASEPGWAKDRRVDFIWE
jgi:peptidoglycan-associated lipoprotein